MKITAELLEGFECGKHLKEMRLASLFWAHEEVTAGTGIIEADDLENAPSTLGAARSLLDDVRGKLWAIPCLALNDDSLLI